MTGSGCWPINKGDNTKQIHLRAGIKYTKWLCLWTIILMFWLKRHEPKFFSPLWSGMWKGVTMCKITEVVVNRDTCHLARWNASLFEICVISRVFYFSQKLFCWASYKKKNPSPPKPPLAFNFLPLIFAKINKKDNSAW